MCKHPKLKFGSGDFYIFCNDCPKKWIAVKQEHPFVADDTANRGPFGDRHERVVRIQPVVPTEG